MVLLSRCIYRYFCTFLSSRMCVQSADRLTLHTERLISRCLHGVHAQQPTRKAWQRQHVPRQGQNVRTVLRIVPKHLHHFYLGLSSSDCARSNHSLLCTRRSTTHWIHARATNHTRPEPFRTTTPPPAVAVPGAVPCPAGLSGRRRPILDSAEPHHAAAFDAGGRQCDR